MLPWTGEGFAPGLSFAADGFRLTLVCFTLLLFGLAFLLEKDLITHKRGRFRLVSAAVFLGVLRVFLSADFGTLLLFFELMSLSSALWVYHEETTAAQHAGGVYLTVAVSGGLFLLSGILLLQHHFGSLDFALLADLCAQEQTPGTLYPACFLLLLGFGAKAGAVPLHIWMSTSYAVAPAPAAALLSALLSKTGIFGILMVCTHLLPGDLPFGKLLLLIGLATMLLGGIRALFCDNVKTTLAYSSLSQMGLLLLGCAAVCLPGAHRELAVWGVVLHMLTHGLSKVILFPLAGLMEAEQGHTKLTGLSAFGAGRAWIRFCFLAAALSLCGFPFFGGFLSKTLLHEALLLAAADPLLPQGPLHLSEGLFLLGGACTVAYMTRLCVRIFRTDTPSPTQTADSGRRRLKVGIAIPAFLLVLSGCLLPHWKSFPAAATDSLRILMSHEIHYYTLENLKGIALSFLGGAMLLAVLFLVTKRRPDGRLPLWREEAGLETLLYRPLLFVYLPRWGGRLARAISLWVEQLIDLLQEHVFNGRWDRTKEAQDLPFAFYDPRVPRTGSNSLSSSLLSFAWGLCFMIAAICFALL